MTTTFTIAIDWDRNNNFTGAQDEVTARVQQVNWFLGMRQPWHDKADNSMLALTLRNDDRLYSPHNTGSPWRASSCRSAQCASRALTARRRGWRTDVM
jgi:hypothetical protein